MRLGNVISTIIENSKRIVKIGTIGSNRETPKVVGVGCIDFSPVKNMKAIVANTSNSNTSIVIGYLNKSVAEELEAGEALFYSTDSNSQLAFIKANKHAEIEINGNDDFAVRFSELEKAYNKLKTDHNQLVQLYNSHIHAGVVVGPGSTAITTNQGSNSTGDISAAKIENIRVP